jgi:hypothetical protein
MPGSHPEPSPERNRIDANIATFELPAYRGQAGGNCCKQAFTLIESVAAPPPLMYSVQRVLDTNGPR